MSPRVPAELCAYCKGVKKLCGAKVCPIILKFSYLKKSIKFEGKRDVLATSPPDFLVGEYGYPIVNLGPISHLDKDQLWRPEFAREKKFDLIDILSIRLNTLYAFDKTPVKIARKPGYERSVLTEIVISMKPVEAEIRLKKTPKPRIFLDPDIPPTGLRAPLERIENVSNAYAPRKVENAVEEDVKASTILPELYIYGLSTYDLIRLLSVGLLGVKSRRKIVPTRWAITATDSILGNFFLSKIKYGKEFSETELYTYKHFGNEYYILYIPNDFWMMEMFEIWMPMSIWVKRPDKPVVIHIHETYRGKPNKFDGGYYAIRLGVLEKLFTIKRKAAVIAVRIVNPEYFAGIGSWQIREGVRMALSKAPSMRGNKDEVLKYLNDLVFKKTGVNIIERSVVLRTLKIKKLDEFF